VRELVDVGVCVSVSLRCFVHPYDCVPKVVRTFDNSGVGHVDPLSLDFDAVMVCADVPIDPIWSGTVGIGATVRARLIGEAIDPSLEVARYPLVLIAFSRLRDATESAKAEYDRGCVSSHAINADA